MGTYIYGEPSGSWEHVANIFAAHNSVHSEKTSSLPLVQFWQPEGEREKPKKAARTLLEKCGLVPDDFCDAQFCFEYPVPVRKGRGKASMTDLMIITDKLAIAVEAKWTECKTNYECISKWLGTSNNANRKDVLDGWIEYINEYLKNKSIGHQICANRINKDIPYQMLHRIASACHTATPLVKKDKTSKAVVIYQLFYNDATKSRMEKFAKKLQKYSKELLGNTYFVRFHIIMTEVKISDDFETIKEQCKTDQGRYDWNALFRKMKDWNIYTFPPDSVQRANFE